MVNTDYKINALGLLLSADCLSERYHPLISCRDALIEGLCRLGCKTKNDAAALSDDELRGIGLCDDGMIRLLRRFLTIYDPSPAKFREIDKLTSNEAERTSYRELYCLPGVKAVRARLYCLSGFRTIRDVAAASEKEILERTARAIAENGLDCIVPLPKEVRTHVAVAKAFVM